MVQPGRPQMIIRRKNTACWITTATDTHSEYVILIYFTQQQRLREGTSMSRYTYIACLALYRIYRKHARPSLFSVKE